IIAVGGHAARPPIPGAKYGLTYEDLPKLTSLPAHVAVVGGADTGCQIASIFADFGVRVTMFELGPVLIPAAGPRVSAELHRAFTAGGMTVCTDTRVEAIDRTDEGISIDYRSGDRADRLPLEAVFFAVGWPASTEKLKLDVAGVRTHRGAIVVDEYQ